MKKGNNMATEGIKKKHTASSCLKLLKKLFLLQVVMPFSGYVRLRFRANNPGFWLFHCHFDWHLPIGEKACVKCQKLTFI